MLALPKIIVEIERTERHFLCDWYGISISLKKHTLEVPPDPVCCNGIIDSNDPNLDGIIVTLQPLLTP